MISCRECITYPICRNKILKYYLDEDKRYSVYWSYITVVYDKCKLPYESYKHLDAENLKKKFEELFNIKNDITDEINKMVKKLYGPNTDGEFKETISRIWNVKNV